MLVVRVVIGLKVPEDDKYSQLLSLFLLNIPGATLTTGGATLTAGGLLVLGM